MEKDRNFRGLIYAITIGCFLLIWLLEPVMENFVSGLASDGGSSSLPFLSLRIQNLGTDFVLNLIPQIKFRWLMLVGLGFWLWYGRNAIPKPEVNNLRWRIRLFYETRGK
jgi:hypothetical protein